MYTEINCANFISVSSQLERSSKTDLNYDEQGEEDLISKEKAKILEEEEGEEEKKRKKREADFSVQNQLEYQRK